MSQSRVRRSVVGAVAGAVTVGTVVAMATTAHASLPGANGKITYNINNDTYVANSDGTGAQLLLSNARAASWAPDGSRVAYVSTASGQQGLWTARADGTGKVQLTTNALDTDPVWMKFGQNIVFSENGQLFDVPAGNPPDGISWIPADFGENPSHSFTDVHPTVSATDDSIVFERDGGATPGVYRYNPGTPASPTLLVAGGVQPDFRPDGTQIAYVVPASGSTPAQVWLVNADGSGATQLTTEANGATAPSWSPDSSSVVYTQGSTNAVKSINVLTKTVTPVVNSGTRSATQPVNQNDIYRVWGQDGTQTAIATSQFNWDDHGAGGSQAQAVVLTRSDSYYDALAGSALAINKKAPLLITSPASTVEAPVLAEIKRVLGTSGTIYLLGGVLAMPQGIQDQLTGLGYTVTRLWGNTHFDTAIAIDHVISNSPTAVIVATGTSYYDPLAAGTAAGANPGTVVVLTDGTNMPAQSASYLNSLNPDTLNLVTAGGPGDTALINAYQDDQMPSWPTTIYPYRLVGNTGEDTAIDLARLFFAGPVYAAIATNGGWQDALTGGAMIGANYGPLLTTSPSAMYGPLTQYLAENSGSIRAGVILGGNLALPETMIAQMGNLISVPGQWTGHDVEPSLSSAPIKPHRIAPQTSGKAAQSTGLPGIGTVKAQAVTR